MGPEPIWRDLALRNVLLPPLLLPLLLLSFF
jgi:hypothetical protein